MGELFMRGQSGGGGDMISVEDAVITLASSSFVYDGTTKTQGVTSVVLNGATLTENQDYVVLSNTATNAGTHTLKVVGLAPEYTGVATANWQIGKASIAKPSLSGGSYTYDGGAKSPTLAGFDGTLMAKGGDETAINAGSYTLTVSILDSVNYKWSDNSTAPATYPWTIAVRSVTKPSVTGTSFTYSAGTSQGPTVTDFDSTWMSKSGDETAVNVGNYTLTISLSDATNCKWSDDSTAAIVTNWSIGKASLTKPSVTGSLTYNTSSQEPTLTGYSDTTMQKSGDTSATNAGSYTLTVSLRDTDNYQWSGGSVAPAELSWSIGKAQGSVSVSPASLSIQGVGSTDTSTVTKTGDGSVSVSSSATGVATASVSGNTVAVTSKGAGTATITVTLAEGDNYLGASCSISVAVKTVTIYGVSWDGTSTTAWSRTDAAENFTDPVPYVAGATQYGSPFDDCMPWSGMEIVDDAEAGKLVSIPKFWYKIAQSGSGMKIQIADNAVEGFSVSPAHMDRGDGKGEHDVVYIGRYHCGATAYKSASGQKPKASVTRANFRTNIHNLGSTIWQADWAMRFTLFLLYLVEFANWNSQDKIGRGCGNNSATQNMGYTDSMPYHTGTTQSSRTTYGLGTQYRHIEGLWDNVYDWVDGCYNNSSGLNLILNPTKFSDSANGISVGTPSNGYPSAFSVKEVNGTFPLFIPSAASGSDSTYSCDNWYFGSSYPCVFAGGGYDQYLARGLFFWYYSNTSSTSGNLGSRSMKLP